MLLQVLSPGQLGSAMLIAKIEHCAQCQACNVVSLQEEKQSQYKENLQSNGHLQHRVHASLSHHPKSYVHLGANLSTRWAAAMANRI